ncbi:selenocysteine lyase/cysteine desulfurase [Rhodoblastus acidophilus]|nr:selenocysteine lyase/cysteine desulfurase [Rhodoblastus acidophilus]MCW2334323.1 selenocysteine lyase/cysteine desulfurase [Rhodoblastus acidophilus]
MASSWAAPRLGARDEIAPSIMEHHANIAPWRFLRERAGAKLRGVECDARGPGVQAMGAISSP